MLAEVGLLACGIAFITNWLALIPWRKAKAQHWAERARLYSPVRTAAAGNLWTIPAVLTMANSLFWPENQLPWLLTFFTAAAGTILGTVPMEREVWPRIQSRPLLRLAISAWFLRFLIWFILLSAGALMPDELNGWVPVIFLTVIGMWIYWSHDGFIRCAGLLGLLVPAPARLQKIVQETADRMNVPVYETLVMRSTQAQAYALPKTRGLLFTERLLETTPDDEIAAICAHELGHITESPWQQNRRYLFGSMYLTWLLFNPLVHSMGAPGFFLLLAITVGTLSLSRSFSHDLEQRADRIAKEHEPNEGVYARALVRLYEDNLAPVVGARESKTHPHLYDRLIAAGVTPDFPRPAAAAHKTWHGSLFDVLVGILATLLVFRLTTQSVKRSPWIPRQHTALLEIFSKTVPSNKRIEGIAGGRGLSYLTTMHCVNPGGLADFSGWRQQ